MRYIEDLMLNVRTRAIIDCLDCLALLEHLVLRSAEEPSYLRDRHSARERVNRRA
jgi:hypothetical protein